MVSASVVLPVALTPGTTFTCADAGAMFAPASKRADDAIAMIFLFNGVSF
jgi:hypothetical protein